MCIETYHEAGMKSSHHQVRSPKNKKKIIRKYLFPIVLQCFSRFVLFVPLLMVHLLEVNDVIANYFWIGRPDTI